MPEFTSLLGNFKNDDENEFTLNLSELFIKLDKKQDYENEFKFVLKSLYKSGQVSKMDNILRFILLINK